MRTYFAAKLKFLQSKLISRSNPFMFLQEFVAAMSGILPSVKEEFATLFDNESTRHFDLFVFDIVTDFV
jgi:hypothetical protein